jgi:hypothetical protein
MNGSFIGVSFSLHYTVWIGKIHGARTVEARIFEDSARGGQRGRALAGGTAAARAGLVSTEAPMKRLAITLILLAGCTRPNDTTTAAMFAIDPTSGVCTPIASATDHGAVAGWQPCSDPCANLAERACKAAQFCQATYRDSGAYRSCRALPQLVDPCKAHDAASCSADSRCELLAVGVGCDCAAPGPCDCPAEPAPQCGLKQCGELDGGDACLARPDCSTTQPPVFETPVSTGTAQPGTTQAGSGTTQPKSTPSGCFPLGGCQGADERDCLDQRACRPIYDGSDHYVACTDQDFTTHCTSKSDCDDGQRSNANGVCVADGCGGETEAECNADPHCEPIYALECSPYANGGGGVEGGSCGPAGAGGGAPLPDEAPFPGTCTCEPTFASCNDKAGGCDEGKSVLVRDPAILDDAFWSLSRVLGAVTGADASVVADAWLAQLGTTQTIGTQTSAARPGAAAYIAALPRRSDGVLDATKLGFVPTALSNRLDLADGQSCGEARITYALTAGVTDRRHRMTVIVELRQPYDGAHCRTVAQSWVALSKLDGAALQSALQAIYTPLLTPANLKQVRTNEFLVGPQDPSLPPAAWELREFHLGADARLHQVLLPLQIDPAAVQSSPDFLTWVQTNQAGLARGTLTFPAQYQVATGSEDGTRVSLSDGALSDLVNKSTCAGCHTTATNSAFAHVAERFQGTGRAEISQFLAGELVKRANHLGLVAAGLTDAPLDVRPLH